MSKFIVGQRFMSETEPELGLGRVVSVEGKVVKVNFLSAKEDRTYMATSAPLKRVIFKVEEEVSLRNGEKIIVLATEEREGLIYYQATQYPLGVSETELGDSMSFNRPEERLFNGQIDPDTLFELRRQTHELRSKLFQSPVRGFTGGRMSLIPHQFYVAHQVAKRPIPRVLLADEVGLGKTVEAGLILHHLICSERIQRVLVLVPDSLVYQWFVEMLRKFNLMFTTLNQETYLEEGSNPFLENELVICNIGLLKGAPLARHLLSLAKWDLLIVDEAHQLEWSQEKVSTEYTIVEEVSKKSEGLMLLTATPEQLGMEGHFARLKLIDPNRFYDYQKFISENAQYEEMAKQAKTYIKNNENEKLQSMLDQHGTGRIFFRNTRANMAKTFGFFPKRILKAYPLKDTSALGLSQASDTSTHGTFAAKVDWLVQFLQENRKQKVLLINRSKTRVLALEKELKERVANLNVGVFHSGLSFLARDRQAAYFADPEGAQILLCTEIGSEGRNFEFAHHLVLFDLPSYPDLLEQRIGRLDRIGQKCDIKIHVPYVLGSYEEVLLRWYHEGFNAFEGHAKGASLIHQRIESLLNEYLQHPENCLKDVAILEQFIQTTKSQFEELTHQLEEGRDVLVELNSYNELEAKKMIEQVKAFDQENDLFNYMSKVFDQLGVDMEDLEEEIFYIKPSDNMFVPSFPNLTSDGVRITFDRSTALRREDVEFLTWDHPMVEGVMDLILSNVFGNMTVATRKKASSNSRIFIEAYFEMSAVAPKKYGLERFFPPTEMRVLIDQTGENFSAKWSRADIDQLVMNADQEVLRKAKALPKDGLQKLLQKCLKLAQEMSVPYKKQFEEQMMHNLNKEIARLEELKKINPSVKEEEIEALKKEKEILFKAFETAEIILDSFRLVL